MKRLFLFAAVICAAVFSSCNDEYDDTALRNELDGLKDRVESLEARLNSEIATLTSLINGKNFVTDVTEVNGGYEITFEDGTSITINNGKDGDDGKDGNDGADGTVIGVQEVDGVVYWTIDGEVTSYAVTGNDGAPGEDGEDGQDGATPEFKDGKWYINGEEVGVAQGDSIFKSATVDSEAGVVTFVFQDGTTFTVPIAKQAKYEDLQSIKFVPEYSDGKATIGYATGAADAFIVAKFEVVPAAAAEVIAKNVKDASMQAVYTKSRAEAGDMVDMPISKIEAEEGFVTVTASGKNLDAEVFSGALAVSVRFAVQDDLSGNATGYIPAVVQETVIVKAAAVGYQGAKLTWNQHSKAASYKVSYDGFTSDALTAAEYEFAEETLTDKNVYEMTVTAYDAEGAEVAAGSVEFEVYTLCNWTEPVFELKAQDNGTYQFIAHNLVNVNYAYGGAVTNDVDDSKSTIEIYKGEELVYTLTNGTGQATLKAWAGYKRWALNAQDDRKDWVWTGINNSGKEVNNVPASWFAPGEYTIKYKIGYVVNKNGTWATNNGSFIPQEVKEGATHVYFANGLNDVLLNGSNVAIKAKEGTSSQTIVITTPIEATAVAQGYQGAKVTWTTTLTDVASWKVSADGYESEAIDAAATEFVVPENSLKGANKVALAVSAYDAEGKVLATGATEQFQIWTLANRPEPVVTLVDGVLTLANAEINEGATKKDNLHIYGAVLEAEIYFYKNGESTPAHIAKGTYLDSYPGTNLPLSYEEKKLKNNIAGAYTAWKWDGAETATKTVPSFEAGSWTVKYKAGYHTFVNAAYGSDRLVFTAPSDALQTMVYREGSSDLTFEVEGATLTATAVADGYQGALVSWEAKNVTATGYEVYVGGTKVAEAAADATSVAVTGLTDAQKYIFEVKALGTDVTASTPETEIYTLCNWTAPEFELKKQDNGTYQFIAHNLVNLNYAYGGAVTNDVDDSKSTIEIYKGSELVYTLTNGTGQATLTAWAGFGRWAFNAQDDRKDWVWTDASGNVVSIKADGNAGEVNAVPESFFTPGEYTIKYKIGYVVNKNGRWAKNNNESDVVANRADGATCVFFGPKDTKPSPNVLYTNASKNAVAIFAKEGTSAFTVAAPAKNWDYVVGAYVIEDWSSPYWNKDVSRRYDKLGYGFWYNYVKLVEDCKKDGAPVGTPKDGQRYGMVYSWNNHAFFDIASTEIDPATWEPKEGTGCYAIINLIDREQDYDKIENNYSYYDKNEEAFYFSFTLTSGGNVYRHDGKMHSRGSVDMKE